MNQMSRLKEKEHQPGLKKKKTNRYDAYKR